MYDDDLFEDNSVESLQTEETTTTETESDDKLLSNSPEFRKLIETLKKELSKVNDFSFTLYTRTFYLVIDHISYRFRSLNDTTAAFLIGQNVNQVPGGMTHETHVQHIELVRSIVSAHYFKDAIGHTAAQLQDHPNIGEPNSYVEYVHKHLLHEHEIADKYLYICKQKYITFCSQHDLKLDDDVMEHGIFGYLTTLDRWLYGSFVYAREMENIGLLENALELRDEYISKVGKYLSDFVSEIERILTKIKNGETAELEEIFR